MNFSIEQDKATSFQVEKPSIISNKSPEKIINGNDLKQRERTKAKKTLSWLKYFWSINLWCEFRSI